MLTLFLGILGASLIFQLFFIIPYIHDAEVENAENHQNEVVRNIAREIDVDLVQTLSRTKELAELDIFKSMNITAMLETMHVVDTGSYRFGTLSVLNSEGMYVCGTIDDFSSYTTKSYEDSEFFSVPFNEGKTHFTKPINMKNKDLYTKWASVPIESDTGERIGVLRAEFKLNHLIETLKNYRLTEEQIAYLVDNEGMVITHTENKLFEGEDASKCPLIQTVINNAESVFQEYKLEGKRYFVTHTQIRTNGWEIVVVATMESVLDMPNAIRNRLLLFNLLLFTVALLVTIIFSQQITASQRKNENAILENDRKFRTYIDNSPISLFIADKNGKYIDVNRAACETLGYSREELLSLTILDIDVTNSKETDSQKLEKLRKTVSYNSEIKLRRKDGTIIDMLLNAVALDANRIMGYCVDISERKLSEEALHESEERYKGIIQSTASCIVVYKAVDNGEDFEIVDFNPMAEKVENIAKEEAIGKKVTEVFPGVIEFGLFKIFQNVWKTDKPEHFPVSIYKDERIQGYRENYVYKLTSGEIVAVYQDFTERKRAEIELKTTKDIQEAILSTTDVLLAFLDRDFNFIEVNQAYADAGRKEREYFIGSRRSYRKNR
ncbi:MAG: PAS domain S-box protein [Planctomycetes bacterium]|nr:PAS domain S-box protein [Planctomycetota bacterium]